MAQTKPNILFIMVDQLAAPFLAAYGHKVVKTPNIDKLARKGVVFENFYSPSPLCAPARAAMMSGQLPSRNRVYDNAAEFASMTPSFAHYLRLAGYRTCLSGKMHFVGPDQLHGFEERLTTDIYPADFGWTPDWRKPQERVDWWYHNLLSVKQAGIAEQTNQLEYDDEVGFQAVRRIYDYARNPDQRPFCLVASFTHPHDPYAARARYWNLYDEADIDAPATPCPGYDRLDPHSQRLWMVSAMDDYDITAHDTLNARRAYYANITYLDDHVGKLVETLEQCGLADDTVIVFTSDHGDFMGERGLWYKMSFLEHAARVPLIVHWPERFSARRVTQPASLLDILPTLTAIAGHDGHAATLDGRSLLPLLDGASETGEAPVFGELTCEGCIAPVFMVRQGNWKLITCRTDPDQLYNLADDPPRAHQPGRQRCPRRYPEPAERHGSGALEPGTAGSRHPRKPAGSPDRLARAAGRKVVPVGLPAIARCIRAVHAQPQGPQRTGKDVALSSPAAAGEKVRLIGLRRAPVCPRPCRAPLPRHRRSARSRHGAP
jgi:choline-sulfatase